MCGIVGYFGGAGNGLTRILTAMSAIIYRAPDSTGAGLFGDDMEPVRTRKAIGSVGQLSRTLLTAAAYPNQAGTLLDIWTGESESAPTLAHQHRLLVFEGFVTPQTDPVSLKADACPTFDALTDLASPSPAALSPGQPGRPGPMPVFPIRSRKDLRGLIERLTTDYDLSFVVIQSLIKNALETALSESRASGQLEVDSDDILREFDALFENVFLEERYAKPSRLQYAWHERYPFARKFVWRYLKDCSVRIPSDYDRDGVRGLFRLLDAAFMCRYLLRPGSHEAMQRRLESLWPSAKTIPNLDWRNLYQAEKGANVYGWAAAAVLIWLKEIELLPALGDALSIPVHPSSPETDPIALRFLSQPVISHGRWAIQSPVTLKNAHPFLDAWGHRAMVLNGQFSAEVETEVKNFLSQTTGVVFRTGNSTEYHCLLWGYYFENLKSEKNRYDDIRSAIDGGFDALEIGSKSIDYSVYQRVKNKTDVQLDEMAFLEATRFMARKGGQIAVSGISLHSPRRFYVAAHNRPCFIVKSAASNDFMVVSDINAAMGLFPQSLIYEKTVALNRLRRRRAQAIQELRRAGEGKKAVAVCKSRYEAEEEDLMGAFNVTVYPLEGAEIFARIETVFSRQGLQREVTLTDFEGRSLPEIKPFTALLSPTHIRKDLYGSFYETHLNEIPERLRDILRTYLSDDGPPELPLRARYLARRFGPGYASLKRIVLTGMGSAHHVGLMAKNLFMEMMPDIDALALQPVVIEDLKREIVPERDLVILVSWSSTTADMVQLAIDLRDQNVAVIGVTEKVFSDMALLAHNSGGVIPVLSGEEDVCSSDLSIVCMLHALYLLALWIADKQGTPPPSPDILNALREAPDTIETLLADDAMKGFSEELAARSSRSETALIFGSLNMAGACREAALKIEENAWTVLGKPFDYREYFYYPLKRRLDDNLVVVNATNAARLDEAITLMKRLYLADIAFAAVSYENDRKEEIAFFSRNTSISLPKLPDPLQPLIDLIFYYRFALSFAQAHGRKADEFPRNRAKSVTASRGRTEGRDRRGSPLTQLIRLEKAFTGGASNESRRPSPGEDRLSPWETAAESEWERVYFRQMRKLSNILNEPDPLKALTTQTPPEAENLARLLFEEIAQEGQIVFVPFDRLADSAARDLALRWRRILGCSTRVAALGDPLTHFTRDDLLIFLAGREVAEGFLLERLRQTAGPCLWVGPDIPRAAVRLFQRSLGCFRLKEETTAFIEAAALYTVVSFLILEAWQERDPEQGDLLDRHFRRSGDVVRTVLHDRQLLTDIKAAMAENQTYATAFLLGPPGGAGVWWMEIFDQSGALALQYHPFGESAHGPLATVDDQIERKFVRLSHRDAMASAYGEETVSGWESRYLSGEGMDAFLKRSPEKIEDRMASPFYAEGEWYLPALRPDYDASQDNLILMDVSSERHIDQALDELSTFGCRHARMVVISQAAFEKKALFKYPVSRFIFLPGLSRARGAGPAPISDLQLPFALGLTGMGMAAAAAGVRGCGFQPTSEATALTAAFGAVGDAMLRHRMDIQYLDHRLIESIKTLSPMVEKVEGVGRYAVKRVFEEKDLLEMIQGDRLYNPQDTLEKYRMQALSDAPFYLLHPEREGFEGRARYLADQNFSEGEWDLWGEPLGNIWKVLTHRMLGIQESADQKPVLLVPLIDPDSGRGWLYCLHVRYREWGHASGDLFLQITETAAALGRSMRFYSYISPRYLKIASHYNEMMVPDGHTWDDRLLPLMRRPCLFQYPSQTLAQTLADRFSALLNLAPPDHKPVTLDEIADALDRLWPSLIAIEDLPDDDRWRRLLDGLTKSLISSHDPS